MASGDIQNDNGVEVNSFNTGNAAFTQLVFTVTNTTINSNYTIQYIEYNNADLTDSFDYSAVDSDGLASNTSTVTFDIEPGAELVYNAAPESDDKLVEVGTDGEAVFSLAVESSDVEDDASDAETTIRITDTPDNGVLMIGDTILSVGDTISEADAESIKYVLNEDIKDDNVAILMGSKGDGSTSDWGALNSEGEIEFVAGDVTATISASNDGIGFSGYDGINSHEGFGLGVVSNSGDDGQIEKHESLTIDFDQPISGATVGLAGLGGHFQSGVNAYAHWTTYDADGNFVAEGFVQNNNGIEVNSFNTGDLAFSQLVLTVDSPSNSNYTLQYIEFNAVTTDSFTYETIDSGDKVSDPAVVTFTIEPTATLTAEHAPTAGDDDIRLDEDASIVFSVTDNDSDIGGGEISVTGNTMPEHGELTFDADTGKFTYTPGENYNGDDSFEYTIVDADGNESTATVNITVDPVNDAPVVTVNGETTTISFTGEEAGYNNVIGLYEMVDGHPQLVKILETNTDYGETGEIFVEGNFGTYEGDGSNLNFFIIANGYKDGVDFDTVTFIDNPRGEGYKAQYVNGEGETVTLYRNVYFDDPSMNHDGEDHFRESVDGNVEYIGIEDLAAPTWDADFHDIDLELVTEGGVTYTEGDSPSGIFSSQPIVTDVDDTHMREVKVTLTNMSAGEDVLSINAGLLPAGVAYTIDGNVITFTGTISAVEDGEIVSGQIGEIIEIPIADVQAALMAIQYNNTSAEPNTEDRVFEITVNDGDVSSNIGQAVVHVEPVDNVPFIDIDSIDDFEAEAFKGHTYANNGGLKETGADNATLTVDDRGFHAVDAVEESDDPNKIETDDALVFNMGGLVTSATFQIEGTVGGSTWDIYDADGNKINLADGSNTADGRPFVTIEADGTATFNSDTPFQYIAFDGGNNGNEDEGNGIDIDVPDNDRGYYAIVTILGSNNSNRGDDDDDDWDDDDWDDDDAGYCSINDGDVSYDLGNLNSIEYTDTNGNYSIYIYSDDYYYGGNGDKFSDFESVLQSIEVESDSNVDVSIALGGFGTNETYTFTLNDPAEIGDTAFAVKPISSEAYDADADADIYSVLDGGGQIDFAGIEDIESIQMAGNEEQSIENLTIDSVLAITDNDNILQIAGGEGDTVDMTGWEQQSEGVFTGTQDGSTATVQIAGDFSYNAETNIVTFGQFTEDGDTV